MRFAVVLTVGLLAFSPSGASVAGVVSHTFTGKVTELFVQGTGSLPFSAGADVVGDFFYEDTTPFTSYSGSLARFENAQSGVNMTVSGVYEYNQTQAAPVYANSSGLVEFGPTGAANPPEIFSVFASSYESGAGLLSASGSFVRFDGNQGMLSSQNTLPGLSIDRSRLIPDRSVARFQSYRFNLSNGNYDEFVTFLVVLNTLDGTPLYTAVPEPSSLATLSAAAVCLVAHGLRRRRAARIQA